MVYLGINGLFSELNSLNKSSVLIEFCDFERMVICLKEDFESPFLMVFTIDFQT